MTDSPSTPLVCHRCARLLTQGEGSFFIVRIEAVADPSPPQITEEDLNRSSAEMIAEYEEMLEAMRDLSEREMLDQIYRKLTLTLCRSCFGEWIENPAG